MLEIKKEESYNKTIRIPNNLTKLSFNITNIMH